MTTAGPGLVGVAVGVGDRIQVLVEDRYYRANSSTTYLLTPEMEFEVTRVYNDSVMARSVNTIRDQSSYADRHVQMSFQFYRGQVQMVDPNRPIPRRLGETPDTPGAISIKDPGIQWLWEDLATFAEQQGYCTQYDALCAKVGIPGRPRDFDVTIEVGGLNFRTTVKARSQREAKEIAEAKIAASTPAPELVSAE